MTRRAKWAMAALVLLGAMVGAGAFWVIDSRTSGDGTSGDGSGSSVQKKASGKASVATTNVGFVPAPPEPARCTRLADSIANAPVRQKQGLYQRHLHSLQGECPRTTSDRGLTGDFFPRCKVATQQQCTEYSSPSWSATSVGKDVSFRLAPRAAAGSLSLRISRNSDSKGYALLTAPKPIRIRLVPYAFTVFVRQASGTQDPRVQMLLACLDRRGKFLTFAAISNLRLLGPVPSLDAPDPRGFVHPTRKWKRFGGYIAAPTWPAGTVAVEPEFLFFQGSHATGDIEVDAVALNPGTRAVKFGAPKPRNLVRDPSFESGTVQLNTG